LFDRQDDVSLSARSLPFLRAGDRHIIKIRSNDVTLSF
jgi:hypothetical protein